MLLSHISRIFRIGLNKNQNFKKLFFKNYKGKFYEQKAIIYLFSILPALGFIVISLYPVHTTFH